MHMRRIRELYSRLSLLSHQSLATNHCLSILRHIRQLRHIAALKDLLDDVHELLMDDPVRRQRLFSLESSSQGEPSKRVIFPPASSTST